MARGGPGGKALVLGLLGAIGAAMIPIIVMPMLDSSPYGTF